VSAAAASLPPGAGADPGAWPCGWLLLDTQGRIVRANAALAHMVGTSAQALVGQSFDSLLTPASRMLYQSYLQPLLRLHGQLALALKGSDGQPLEVLVYSTCTGNGNGEHAATEFVLAPIRRRRRIEEELLRVKHAADHAPGLIFQLRRDTHGRLSFPYVSEAVRRLYGATPEQAQTDAHNLLDRVLLADREPLLAGLEHAVRGGCEWHGTYRVRRVQPGAPVQELVHEMHVTGGRLADGQCLWHGHIADVTQREALQSALAQQHTAVQVQQARSTLLARISHELRTPLNGVLGFIELVLSDSSAPLTAMQRSRLDIARSSGKHLLHLVNQVLDLSQAETLTPATLQPLPLDQSIAAALQVVQPQAMTFGVTLLPPDCSDDLWVLGHEPAVHQVLINLLSNAIKYNRIGGLVTTFAERHAGGVAVHISDTGPGLSQAQQADLFQPFNRLGAQHGDRPGTGLGLVITRQLVQQLGGRIGVESELGAGACFTVWLQAAEPQHREASDADAVMAAGDGAQPAAGRVLYVEDNPVNAVLMEAIIAQRPGVVLRIAADAAAALSITAQWKPDLLLLDLHLPDMSGTALLTELRRNPALQAVPAIVVSAAAEVADQQRAAALGFEGYWVKPLDIGHTLRELDRWLAAPGDA
jgi:PAS domain S-box-containing protein